MELEQQIKETLKRTCKTDCEQILKTIPTSLIIGNCLKPIRNGIYSDYLGREYSIVVSKHKKSPRYSLRIVLIEDIA
ncbi:hypothetical protein H8D91_02210 [archaeon]|nr:hypothetical protein [archaeon]